MHGVKNNNYKFRLHPRLMNAIINRVNKIVDISASKRLPIKLMAILD